MSSIEPYTDCCDVTTYYAEATSTAKAYTTTGEKVTSTSSATATSHESYDDALETAQKIADEVAQSNADHDANVIDEAVKISNGNNDDVVVLENLSSTNNEYEIQDNTDIIYIKSSTGNATNLPEQIFPFNSTSNFELNGAVMSLEKDNSGNIYAGGHFTYTAVSSVPLNGVGKWDGNKWNTFNNGFYNSGNDFTVNSVKLDNNENLYAGGLFKYSYTNIQTTLNSIAKWNGSSWVALGTGLQNTFNTPVGTLYLVGTVFTMSVDSSNNVYAGGIFTSAGDVANTSGIAKWNGSAWSSLKGGILIDSNNVLVNTSVIDSSNNLYVAGNFVTVYNGANGTVPVLVNGIAKWNITTSSWSALGLGIVDGIVESVVVDSSNNIYVGGGFTQVKQTNGDILTVYGIAKWNGSVWSNVGPGFKTFLGVAPAGVTALEFDFSKNLIACGSFERLADGSKLLSNIASWNGTTWNSVGDGVKSGNTFTHAILLSDENEIIIGSNSKIAPINAYAISTSYISKISNSYVNVNYNNERLFTYFFNGQSIPVRTVKNNSSNKKVGYFAQNIFTETFV